MHLLKRTKRPLGIIVGGAAASGLFASAFAFSVGCSSAVRDGFGDGLFDDGGAAGDPNSTVEGGTTVPATGFGSDGGLPDAGPDLSECPPSATLVYVTGVGSKLYSFDPQTQDFTLIGKFSCLSDPTHMTVDRQGNAWVVAGGKIYKASTTDATCAAVTTWKTSNIWSDFALTFVGTTATDNTLYMLNAAGTLGSFDTASGVVTQVKATVDIPEPQGDMTSNGDGTLYFAEDIQNHPIFRLDPTTGDVVSQAPNTSSDNSSASSQALAFWGGTFYVFVNADIYAYDPVAKTNKNIGTAPIQVTGAGQSTCVPKVPPPVK